MFQLTLCIALLASVTHQAVVPSYEIEVYFVVDRAVVDRYVLEREDRDESLALNTLRTEIDYFISELNKLFSSLEARGLNIRVLKKQLDILEFNLFSQNSDVDPGLKSFDAWLSSTSAHSNIQYDAAILWTGFELTSNGDSAVAGYAHVGQICHNVNSSGIVEFDMTYMTSVSTAHELAHIMGAEHDAAVTGFIMVPKSSATEPNRWDFSLCTKEAFAVSMSKLSENCLLNSSPGSVAPSQNITEHLADPDVICQRHTESQNSYMCKSSAFYDNVIPHGDSVCDAIYCKKPGTSFCTSAFAPDGLICGTNKRCLEGQCVDHPDSESGAVNDNCIWGDVASVSYNTDYGPYEGDCQGFIDLMGASICSNAGVATQCCMTCTSHHTGIEGCEYGDIYGSCNIYEQWQICGNPGKRAVCCLFCQGYESRKKRSVNPDIEVKLGMKAPGKVTENLKLKPEPGNSVKAKGGPTELA